MIYSNKKCWVLRSCNCFYKKLAHYWGMSKEKTGTIIKCISVKKKKNKCKCHLMKQKK